MPKQESGPSRLATGTFQIEPDVAVSVKRQARAAADVPRAMRVEREGAPAVVLTLYPDRTYVFGRAPESSVVFPDDAVSRLHAHLRFVDGEWFFRDLNSTNGSFRLDEDGAADGEVLHVGGKREHRAVVGQTLLLGNRRSRLVFLDAAPEPTSPRTSATSAASQRLERSIAVCAHHRLPVFLLGASRTGKTHGQEEFQTAKLRPPPDGQCDFDRLLAA